MDQTVAEEKKIERQVGSIIDNGRVVAFSDAVFAFAATLLVLKIDFPIIAAEQVDAQFIPTLRDLWPQYLANLISFLVIGFYWLNHHAIFGLIRKFNPTVVWINIVFLVFLSFIPFPVDLYGDYFNVPIVVAFYSATLSIVGVLLLIIWLYASDNNRLVDEKLSKRRINYYTMQFSVAPLVFALAVPIAFILPIASQLSWLFVILGLIIVNRIFKYKKMSELEKMAE